ncbi:hypothetical protein [Bradyrhizobium jicamae]|uniref:hypothetical protein n=1 Tax=Bradyrhizobium jicamae TaxID=280332 RepID=UPI001BACB177|nr:hypothetical protein [Bradyrhizobium jicamae]MBR0934485.1 hypothetical protein [Bradyrhizobium jicamae]
MWKRLWQTWTIDKPAVLGDRLWQILVVDLAAFLDRLTLRRMIALIPVAILILAYLHRIPLPPEFMLLGDLFAYIDVFSMIFLIGLVARASAIAYALRQAAGYVLRAFQQVPIALRRLDMRHRRANGARRRTRFGRADTDDEVADVHGLAWA